MYHLPCDELVLFVNILMTKNTYYLKQLALQIVYVYCIYIWKSGIPGYVEKLKVVLQLMVYMNVLNVTFILDLLFNIHYSKDTEQS